MTMSAAVASLILSIAANCASLLLVKQAMAGLGAADPLSPTFWVGLVTNWALILGVLCFGVSFVTWALALTRIDLSLAYPSVSVSYIIIALASNRLFGEALPPGRWVGICVICAGVALLYWKG